MRSIAIALGSLSLVSCLHSSPRYPGAGGDNLDPGSYAATPCPDISGRFEGRGTLVEGDPSAQRMARFQGLNSTFPFRDNIQASEVRAASLSADGKYRAPSYGDVIMDGRQIRVKLTFSDGKSFAYLSSIEDKSHFVCTGEKGRIIWGGVSKIGRSEFGPNKSDAVVSLYIDENGDLVSEEGMQVHMNLQLGVPAGTAQYFSKYKFRRLR